MPLTNCCGPAICGSTSTTLFRMRMHRVENALTAVMNQCMNVCVCFNLSFHFERPQVNTTML